MGETRVERLELHLVGQAVDGQRLEGGLDLVLEPDAQSLASAVVWAIAIL